MSDYHRTKTYLAGDWTGDKDAIDKIHEWNESDHYALNFVDVHDIVQASDDSLPCSIKKSLGERMDMCKTFVLVVGEHTKYLTKGECRHCGKYRESAYYGCYCANGGSISNKNYVEFECDKAVRDGLRIVVLYNSKRVDRYKCPDAVRWEGKHIAMKDDYGDWNYQAVKKAIMGE